MLADSIRLLKFEADWCAPCKSLGSMLASTLPNYPHVKLEKIDVDMDPKTAEHFRVTSLPTLVVLDDQGSEITRTVGMLSRAKLDAMLSTT